MKINRKESENTANISLHVELFEVHLIIITNKKKKDGRPPGLNPGPSESETNTLSLSYGRLVLVLEIQQLDRVRCLCIEQ